MWLLSAYSIFCIFFASGKCQQWQFGCHTWTESHTVYTPNVICPAMYALLFNLHIVSEKYEKSGIIGRHFSSGRHWQWHFHHLHFFLSVSGPLYGSVIQHFWHAFKKGLWALHSAERRKLCPPLSSGTSYWKSYDQVMHFAFSRERKNYWYLFWTSLVLKMDNPINVQQSKCFDR